MTFKNILLIHESEYLPKSYSHWKRYKTNTEGYPAVQKAYKYFIHANPPGLSGSLPHTTPISRTGRFISRIKSSFELFSALV